MAEFKFEEIKSESPEKREAASPIEPSPPSTETTSTTETTSEATLPTASGEENIAEVITQQYQTTRSDTSPMMKVGCIAVVIGICIIFLFALFVLPN